jgi:hypothetical protein
MDIFSLLSRREVPGPKDHAAAAKPT